MEAEEATGHVSLPWQHFGCCSSELTWDDDDDELISVMNQEGLTRPLCVQLPSVAIHLSGLTRLAEIRRYWVFN